MAPKIANMSQHSPKKLENEPQHKPDSTRNGKRRSFESSVYCFTHALLVYFPLLLLAFVNVSPLFSHVILLFVNKVPYSSSPLPFFALALQSLCFLGCFAFASVSLQTCFASRSLSFDAACPYIVSSLTSSSASFLRSFALLALLRGGFALLRFAFALVSLQPSLLFAQLDFVSVQLSDFGKNDRNALGPNSYLDAVPKQRYHLTAISTPCCRHLRAILGSSFEPSSPYVRLCWTTFAKAIKTNKKTFK